MVSGFPPTLLPPAFQVLHWALPSLQDRRSIIGPFSITLYGLIHGFNNFLY